MLRVLAPSLLNPERFQCRLPFNYEKPVTTDSWITMFLVYLKIKEKKGEPVRHELLLKSTRPYKGLRFVFVN